jgi:hypothetical protein
MSKSVRVVLACVVFLVVVIGAVLLVRQAV